MSLESRTRPAIHRRTSGHVETEISRRPTLVADLQPPAEEGRVTQLLRVACESAVFPLAAAMPGAAREEIAAMLTLLSRAARGSVTPAELARARGCGVPAQRALDALRLSVLRHAGDDPLPSGPLVELLLGLERVREQLHESPAHSFVSALAGPHALDLLVEVAHDMRSPLTSILFLVETLRKKLAGAIDPAQERQLGIVHNASFGLSLLANDVIELAGGGDRLLEPQPTQFTLAETFYALSSILAPIAEEKELQLACECSDAHVRVGHPAALHRVLLNLATNALKFTSEGSVRIHAEARGRSAIAFAVSDSGRGIPDHALKTLFSAFRPQSSSRQNAFSSAGLGLAISKHLVGAMGGDLQVRSEMGVGTTFEFVLELPPARSSGATARR